LRLVAAAGSQQPQHAARGDHEAESSPAAGGSSEQLGAPASSRRRSV